MLYLGLFALGIASFYFVSCTVSAMREVEEEYRAVYAMLLHIRGALSSGGGALCEIIKSFRSDVLEKRRMISCLASDPMDKSFFERNASEYAFFRDKLSDIDLMMDKTDSEKLIKYLSSYGKNYLEEEKKKLDEIIAYFASRSDTVAEKNEKNIKVIRTMFAFFYVGIVILLV